MANRSSIEWTQVTWNPVRGCTKISPGCKHCYASAFAERFRGVPNHPYEQGFDIRTVPGKLLEPLAWNRSSTVFVNSMSDLFHPDIPQQFLLEVVEVMVATPWHTYQVLTKRADRLRDLLGSRLRFAASTPNIWWGVSVEDVKYGLPRIEQLRSTAARTKFLSIEPLLENLGQLNVDGIDWVIVGGESGVAARPVAEDWIENIRLSCESAGVPFFFKQWGGRNKKAAGRLYRGRTYDAMPVLQKMPIPSKVSRMALREELVKRFGIHEALIEIVC